MAPREPVRLRLALGTVEWLDKLAVSVGSTRSDVIRACIAVGRSRELDVATKIGEKL